MTVGSAIFLSSLMIAITILYSSTKDRWNWKKITKKIVIVIVLIIVACIAFALYLVFDSKVRNSPSEQSQLEGIKIGDSKEDILFKKGATTKGIDTLPAGFYPDFVIETKNIKHGPWENYQDRTNVIRQNSNREKQVKIFGQVVAFPVEMSDKEIGEIIRNYVDRNRDVLSYKDLDIILKDDKAIIIRKICSDDDNDHYTSLNHLECKDSYEELESMLGKAKFIKCSNDSLTRIYSFPQYKTAYVVNKDGIKQLIVYEPKYEEELTSHNKNFGNCKT